MVSKIMTKWLTSANKTGEWAMKITPTLLIPAGALLKITCSTPVPVERVSKNRFATPVPPEQVPKWHKTILVPVEQVLKNRWAALVPPDGSRKTIGNNVQRQIIADPGMMISSVR